MFCVELVPPLAPASARRESPLFTAEKVSCACPLTAVSEEGCFQRGFQCRQQEEVRLVWHHREARQLGVPCWEADHQVSRRRGDHQGVLP